MTDEEINNFRQLKGFQNLTGRTKFFDKLIARLRNSNLEFQLIQDIDEDVFLKIGFPNAREKRFISVYNKDNIKNLLSTKFENYVFIEDYLAICDYNHNIIEAIIGERNLGPTRPSRLMLKRLFGAANELDFENGDFKIELNSDDVLTNYIIKIGPVSDGLYFLSGFGIRRQISLSIKGVNFTTQFEKKENSQFFSKYL